MPKTARAHTPGPWKVHQVYAPEHKCLQPTPYILDVENRNVATAAPRIANEEDAANARLIAAAPELLEAIRPLFAEAIRLYLEHEEPEVPNSHSARMEEVFDSVRAAVAKAEATIPPP